MTEWLLITGLIVWTIVGGLVALLVCRAIRIADEREPVETQCGFVFEGTGRRCQWYRGHPLSWGHRFDAPSLLIGGER